MSIVNKKKASHMITKLKGPRYSEARDIPTRPLFIRVLDKNEAWVVCRHILNDISITM